MSEDVRPSRTGRKGCCLIGCLGIGLAALAGLVGTALWFGSLTSRFGDAEELKAQRERLEAERPFRPSADGRVPPDRLEAYVSIRARTADTCARISGFFDRVREVEEAAEREGEEPGFAEAMGIASAAFQLPGMLADYFEARNRALVEHEMGMEEWRWYTVLAYRSAGGTFLREGTPLDRRDARGSGGDRELARRTLLAQLEAAREAGPETVGADWIATLEAEAARLDEPEAEGWPWHGGLPERVRESLEAQGERLRQLHCTGSEDVELDEVEKDGVSIQVR